MIISHRHRFIFVKGAKVGGTSVEMALTALCGPDDIVTPVTPVDDRPRIDAGHPPRHFARTRATEAQYVGRVRNAAAIELDRIEVPVAEQLFFNHMPLARAERMLGERVDGYTVVCVERRPYDKVVSLANWFLQAPAYAQGRAMQFDLERTRATIDTMIGNGFVLRCRNLGRYRRRRGELALRVLRLSSLAADFAALMQDLGVPAAPTIPHAKKGNWKAEALDVLTREQVLAINELFRDEFAFFGFATA